MITLASQHGWGMHQRYNIGLSSLKNVVNDGNSSWKISNTWHAFNTIPESVLRSNNQKCQQNLKLYCRKARAITRSSDVWNWYHKTYLPLKISGSTGDSLRYNRNFLISWILTNLANIWSHRFSEDVSFPDSSISEGASLNCGLSLKEHSLRLFYRDLNHPFVIMVSSICSDI